MKADKLESIVDLSRAMILTDWRYVDRDPDLLRVDLDVFKSVADRFESAFKKRLASNRPGQQAAAAILVGVMAVPIPASRLGLGGLEARRRLATNIVRDLASLTASTDYRVRAAAARALGRILANTRDERGADDTKVIFDTLNKLYDTQDARTRLAVANALGDFLRVFSEKQVDPKETASIEQKDFDVITDQVLPLSFKMLADEDSAVRRRSIDTMERFTELMARRLRPLEAGVRRAPGELEGPRRQLRGVRAKLEQFDNYADQIKRLLQESDLFLRGRTLRMLEDLAAIRSNVRAGTLPDVADRPGDKRWFEPLFKAVMPALLSNLEHPTRLIRLTAVEILENLGPDAHAQAPVLVKILADPDLIVRWAAARALGRIDGKPVPGEIEALGRALSDQDLAVRV